LGASAPFKGGCQLRCRTGGDIGETFVDLVNKSAKQVTILALDLDLDKGQPAREGNVDDIETDLELGSPTLTKPPLPRGVEGGDLHER
jgi:hypothetical protein